MKNDCHISKHKRTLFLVLIALFIFLIFRSHSSVIEELETKEMRNTTLLTHFRAFHFQKYEEDPRFNFNSSTCNIEEWNRVQTNSIPNMEYYEQLMREKVTRFDYLFNTSPSPFSAYAYDDHIAVILTSERNFSHTVTCRYYDCKKNEIMDPFESKIFPSSTVFCPRRIGAEYISISNFVDGPVEFPVPIIPRVMKKPKHYLSVCMSTLYGDEPKFLQISDFIEHYRFQGATFFTMYVRNVSEYDRFLLDDYVRTGDVELVKMQDHYWRADFMWHRVQIHECHHRSINFAKWTAFVDIDEKIEMKTPELPKLVNFLDIIDPEVSTLHFKINWVIKNKPSPPRYINDQQLREEMIFRKFTNTSTKVDTWMQPKCVVRPEKIAIMSIHDPIATYKSSQYSMVNEKVAIVRHYRNTFDNFFFEQVDRMMFHGPFKTTKIDQYMSDFLTKQITDRVKYVYDIPEISCEQKQRFYIHEKTDLKCKL